MQNRNIILTGILALAFVVRMIGLAGPDIYTDEVLYAFRAIENVDFDEAADQTTPLEWFDESRTQIPDSIPWWTSWSFHDHPPLFFWALNISITVFGENPYAVRLPSVLFGLLAVYAVYVIGKELANERAGLIASLLLAVTTNHLYISRIGLQESMLIALGLMGIASVLRAERNSKQYLIAAIYFGLAFLTKYNAVLFMALAGVIVLARGIKTLPIKKVLASAGIFIVVISPVLIYNIMLYRAVGHFDFQLSYVFNQHPEVWQVTPGKEIGSLAFRAQSLFPNILRTNSPLFLVLAVLGALALIAQKHYATRSRILLIAFPIVIMVYLVGMIGVSYRFITMLTPFFALLAGVGIAGATTRLPQKALIAIGGVIVLVEIVYGLNTVALASPYGSPVLTYAEKTHTELESTGYRALGEAIEKDLEGYRTAQAFSMKYAFLTDIHERVIDEQSAKGLPQKSVVIVYDPDIHNLAQLWYLDRLNIYHAWPVLNIDQYAEYASLNKLNFPEANFKEHIIIILGEGALSRRAESLNQSGEQMEAILQSRGIAPERILAPSGVEAFRVYRF